MGSESSTNRPEDVVETLKQTESEFGLSLIASTLAHEIRNPLQTIRLQVETSLRGGSLAKAAPTIFDSLQRIEAVVEKVQKLGQKYVVHPERVNLRELLNSCISSVSFWLNASGVQVRMQCHWEGEPIVFADRELVQQVILNLLMNAIQAMPDGGILTIVLSETTEDALIEVQDTGVGISAQSLRVVGTPFYTTKPDGHGLGLAFCKTIASLHKGSAEIESKEGKGTLVNFRISKNLGDEEEIGNA